MCLRQAHVMCASPWLHLLTQRTSVYCCCCGCCCYALLTGIRMMSALPPSPLNFNRMYVLCTVATVFRQCAIALTQPLLPTLTCHSPFANAQTAVAAQVSTHCDFHAAAITHLLLFYLCMQKMIICIFYHHCSDAYSKFDNEAI